MKIELTQLDADSDLRKSKEKRKIKNSSQDLKTEGILFPFGELAMAFRRIAFSLAIKVLMWTQ